MRELIGQNNFPFFSVSIGEILATRFFRLYMVCSVIAVAHVAAEWLYLGKYPRRFWLGLLAGLCLLGLSQIWVVHPALGEAHKLQFRGRPAPEQREQAARSFKAWQGIASAMNYLMLTGLVTYFWRMGNPIDPMRFVSARQFRS